MNKKKVIIDSDYGTYYDDAFALLYAVQNEELDILAVNSSYGDTKLRARIAKKLLRVANRSEIPVYAGIPGSMSGGAYMFGFEGQNILTEEDLEDPTLEPDGYNADDVIIEAVTKYPHEVTIITTGTVTNVAAALIKEPKVAELAKELIIMGGVIVPIVDEKGISRSPIEEYNLNNDTFATQIVWKSGINITLVPIDVTLKVPLSKEQIEKIQTTDTPIAKQVSDIISVWPEQEYLIYTSVGIPTEFTGLWLHDPLTIGVALDRSFIKEAKLHVDAEFAPTVILRDMIVRDDILRTIPKKMAPNMNVAIGVDNIRFTEEFTNKICKK
ncbi:MAG: nucleoside hydrolase [Lachnospiraceae bacterium]|jgi:purine nucleosidase|nr:nucleoside hydrolase [Lachnospiraceae bacterium]